MRLLKSNILFKKKSWKVKTPSENKSYSSYIVSDVFDKSLQDIGTCTRTVRPIFHNSFYEFKENVVMIVFDRCPNFLYYKIICH